MGIILPQNTCVKLSVTNRKYYEEKGYEIPNHLDDKNKTRLSIGEHMSIHVLDLPRLSHVKVKILCDYCGNTYENTYETVCNIYEHEYHNKCACKNCSNIKKSELQQYIVDRDMNVNPLYRDKEWLYEEYIAKNRCAEDIANECRINVRNLRSYIEKFNLDIKMTDTRDKMPYELLYSLYIDNKFTTKYIATEYHCKENNIKLLLCEYLIPRRTAKESIDIYYNERNGRIIKSNKSLEVWKYDGFKEKMKKINKLHANKLSSRIKMSASSQRISIDEWNGFVSSENRLIRNQTEYKEWRRSVFEKDDYTCQCCGKRNGNGETVYLNAHHKEGFADNPVLRFEISNGITLCKECHDPRIEGSFHNLYGTHHNTTEQLNEYIAMKQSEVA